MFKPKKYLVSENITKKQYNWLTQDIKKGTIVYECIHYNYNCCTNDGIACTFNPEGDYPFIELPTKYLIKL